MKKIFLSLFIACSFFTLTNLEAQAASHPDGHNRPASVNHSKPHKPQADLHHIKVHHYPTPKLYHLPLHYGHHHCANIYCPRCGYRGAGVNYYYHGDNFSFGISL